MEAYPNAYALRGSSNLEMWTLNHTECNTDYNAIQCIKRPLSECFDSLDENTSASLGVHINWMHPHNCRLIVEHLCNIFALSALENDAWDLVDNLDTSRYYRWTHIQFSNMELKLLGKAWHKTSEIVYISGLISQHIFASTEYSLWFRWYLQVSWPLIE